MRNLREQRCNSFDRDETLHKNTPEDVGAQVERPLLIVGGMLIVES